MLVIFVIVVQSAITAQREWTQRRDAKTAPIRTRIPRVPAKHVRPDTSATTPCPSLYWITQPPSAQWATIARRAPGTIMSTLARLGPSTTELDWRIWASVRLVWVAMLALWLEWWLQWICVIRDSSASNMLTLQRLTKVIKSKVIYLNFKTWTR